MKHKQLTFVLAVLMSMVASVASAYDIQVDGIYYNLTGMTATVTYKEKGTSNKNAYSGDIVIPETFEYYGATYTVIAIGESAFWECKNITSVSLPETIKSIGTNAFFCCEGLTSFVIPDNVSTLGDAFMSCSNLESIVIGKGIRSIPYDCFLHCSSLKKMTIKSNALLNTGKYIGYFGAWPSEIVITEDVASIGANAFSGNGIIKSVTLPETITSIGESAFQGCSALSSFTIPSNVTFIGASAFKNCGNLKNVKIPAGVTEINNSVFSGCSSLEGEIKIPDAVTSIGDEAFYNCAKVTSLKFGEGLKEIGADAFTMCDGITELIIPNNVETIGKEAFQGCSGLTKLVLGRGIKEIGQSILTTITGDNIGNHYINIKDIYCYAVNVPKTGSRIVDDGVANKVTLHVPSASVSAYKAKEPWNKFNIVAEVIHVETIDLGWHELTLNVGGEKGLSSSITPYYADNRNIIWTTSDEKVVSVDDYGNVTAVGQGEAWVKATSEDNPEAKDSCLVTVVEPVTGVTISHTEYALNGIGKSIQLEAAVQPNDATNKGVTWSSSNESVCTVKDGLVTAKGKGTAIITVKTVDGGFTASCTVTVTQAVTGITLNYEDYTLNDIGESVQLTVTVTREDVDNKNITWASLNENVCRVTYGYVLAVGEGTTIITATSADGEVSAKCTVTVKVPKAVTGVMLDKETLILHVIGESVQLTASVLPEDAGNKNVTWSTSNDAVCMVSNTGKVVATGEGSAVISVKTEDGGFTASCNVKVSFSHPVTGITLNQESITFDVIGQSAQLVATVVPNEATEKGVTWSSSNESVCMVSSTGFIVAVGNGTADITATTIDGGFTATCKVKVEDITPVNSVDAKAQGYKIYDLQGRERKRLQRGVNIIRFSDGTTKKVLVK